MPSGETVEAPRHDQTAQEGVEAEAPGFERREGKAAHDAADDAADDAALGAAEEGTGEEVRPEAGRHPAEERRAAIEEPALEAIFRAARTHNKFRDEPVSDETLQALYELLKWGPTSANCSPARFVFLRTPEAKERLRPALSPGNVEKTMAAPVTVIVAYDPKFYDRMSHLFPHSRDAGTWFADNQAFAAETAFRNGSLQGAYLIIAARALGLDCGPMSGFDKAKVDEEFFTYRGWKSNFLCNLGHGDPEGIFPRLPRLEFSEACDLL